MSRGKRIPRFVPGWCRRFARDERGVISVQNLLLTLACCAIGAVGLDVTSFFAARTELQVAADIAAHSALLRRNQGTTTVEKAKSDALDRVRFGMPEAVFGQVIETADITFGRYVPATRTFIADETSRSAVRVLAGRDEAGGNPVQSLLFRTVGVDQMDVRTQAVALRYTPQCLVNGFAAKQEVKITSGNQFFDDFCIHSNVRVNLNNNNGFELGTVVSMPNKNDISVPPSGWRSNLGLEQALQDGTYDFRILDRIATGTDLQVGIVTMNSADQQRFAPWLTSGNVTTVSSLTVSPASFTQPAGSVYAIVCGNNKTLTMNGGTYRNMVLLTNCPIKMSGGVTLDQAIISTTNDSVKSITANSAGGSGIQIGRLDKDCAAGGGAAIITRGGFDVSAKLSFYGGQILALKDVSFASHVEGYGLGIITAGKITGTTDIDAFGCPENGMESAIIADYYRLAL